MNKLTDKNIIITGAAGFIGSNLVMELMRSGEPMTLIGLDNMNDYYDVSLKEYRLSEIEKLAQANPQISWTFIKGDLADKALIDSIFAGHKPDIVVNLAAQAGVRYSIENPDAYIQSNLMPTSKATSSASTTFWKPADTMEWSISSMPAAAAFTARTRKSPTPQTTKWTIPSASMLPRRRATN